MYGHAHPMTMTNQIATADDDDGASPVAGAESVDNPHIHHYDGHALDDTAGGVPAGAGGVVEDVNPDAVYDAAAGYDLVVQRIDGSSQLTLSFRGQVYVFDAVTPDKVQAVLLLLGGCEISAGAQGVGMPSQNHRAMVDLPVRCSQPHRAASLSRFRQKRKERCFDKKVRYSVRQEVALRMQRNKGQFTSKKSDGTYSWGNGQDSGPDDNPLETSCTHCGTSSKSTPMMRRGPSGPRSLCNACGLFWANRGTLRDLSKKTQDHSQTPVEQNEGEASDSNCETTMRTHSNLATFSNGDGSALMAEQ
ncbi:GATA transcription factor [Parasponia andersonii]|uniref:GATA transcription factor n=1 Tax=Parasponia andersonii TaxID=3476 RepID=A0A2P5CEY4_PARAD|nr:GATA transcription factor [Parasponia andersonii]